jgi:glycosyltransferase involved in cell wall biosynthesis/polysaccharide pyruvyl transferase WcaK-like protein
MLAEIPQVSSVQLLDLSGRPGFATQRAHANGRERQGAMRRLHRWLYARIDPYAAFINLLRNRWLASHGRRRSDLAAKLAECDHLVIGGGQLLRDSRLAFPSKLATIVEVAESLGVTVSYFAVGVGSRWSALGRRYFRSALTRPNVRAIYCRDLQSSRRLERYLPMLAGLVRTTCDAALGVVHEKGTLREANIGLCVMSANALRWTAPTHPLVAEAAAIRFWIRLYDEVVKLGMPVRLFTNGAPEDQEFAERVAAEIRRRDRHEDLQCLSERPRRPEELVHLVRSFSAIVAFRLHANIVAYTSGVQNVALAWDDKVEQFMKYTGQSDRFIAVDDDLDGLVARTLEALTHGPKPLARETIAATVRQDLEHTIEEIASAPGNTLQPVRPRLAYFVTEDWYFCSHRLPLAIAAKEAGYDVFVITREASHGELIRSAGLRLVPVNLVRRSLNPFREAAFIRKLFVLYRDIRPDIVHHVAMKPVLYGTLSARLARVPAIVNALAGLGYLFSSDSRKVRLARPFLRSLLRLLLNARNVRLILQNPDDVAEFSRHSIGAEDQVSLISGSGVDISEYRPQPEPNGVPVVLLASRLLWDKGVAEFVDAARSLRKEGSTARFVLAGEPDEENPNAVSMADLQNWLSEGTVEWIGKRDDMPTVFAESHIVCLPSYREGLPKVLIEASACARPIVTTDAPGCREVVKHRLNGLLVPIRDSRALADAIAELLESRELRARMGRAGRERVEEKFELKIVIDSTLEVYRSMVPTGDE